MVTAPYETLLTRLRTAFPAPTSDPVHDGYVVFSLLRALDQVDALKSHAPVLGTPRDPDWPAARGAVIDEGSTSLENVIPQLVACLHGMPQWGHPNSQVNVIAYPSIAALVGAMLPTIHNPNLCSEESGCGFSEAEVRVIAMTARLIGYDAETAGGLFTFGGSGTLLYGIKLGLEKAVPGAARRGLAATAVPDKPPVVFASDCSHYAVKNVAAWLGLGLDHVRAVVSDDDNAMNLAALEKELRAALSAGLPVAAIIATMGTTDAFGIDDLDGIVALRDRLVDEFGLPYRPHVHADAVIGWAWSVFADYDFGENRLGFPARTCRALAVATSRLRRLARADSLGVDFHKTGFAPYVSSAFLIRDGRDFAPVARDRAAMPYIFHSGEHHPGTYSLETSRGAQGPMTALANLMLLGKEGFRTLLGHAVDVAQRLREQIAARPELTVVNDRNHGPVTLFRAYPPGVDTYGAAQRELRDPSSEANLLRVNAFNREIHRRVQTDAMAGTGVAIGFTERARVSVGGQSLCALKAYALSPFVDERGADTIVERVLLARRDVLAS